jgi:hypothetical protein
MDWEHVGSLLGLRTVSIQISIVDKMLRNVKNNLKITVFMRTSSRPYQVVDKPIADSKFFGRL